MRHGSKNKKFNRKRNVRNALFKSLAVALIDQKSIKTTEPKAKALRPFIEKMVTKAIKNDIASKKVLESNFSNKIVVKKLTEEIAMKLSERKGGYTRIIKLPKRMGDAAPMAKIEFVGL